MIHELVCEGCCKVSDDLYDADYIIPNTMVCKQCKDYEEELKAQDYEEELKAQDMRNELMEREWSDEE